MSEIRRGLCDAARVTATALGVKFLIDNALPPRLAELLTQAGHNTTHVRAYGMHAAAEAHIFGRARRKERVLASVDADLVRFSLLRKQLIHHSCFFAIRIYSRLKIMLSVLTGSLPLLKPDLTSGCKAVFRNGRLRVRKLPFPD